MKFTKIIKNKDAIQYLSVLITIVLVIAIQVISGYNSQKQQISDVEVAEMIISQNDKITTKLFFTIIPALNSISNYNNLEGIKNLAILAVESFLVYYIVCSAISKIYIKAVTELSSMGSKKGKKINFFKEDFKKVNCGILI